MQFDPANLIVALDEMSLPQARKMVELLKPSGCRFKVGMQLHSAFASLTQRLQDFLTGPQMMLDLKRHDIPNTVVHTVYDDCMTFSPAFYTINVPLNDASFAAAITRNAPEFPNTTFLGITVLTSVSDGSDGSANLLSRATAGRFSAAAQAVQYYAELAVPQVHYPNVGLVCSPLELSTLCQNPRTARLRFVCPGIRPAGTAANDQARVTTPVAALQDGATALVIGRPITKATDPRAALDAILADIAQA